MDSTNSVNLPEDIICLIIESLTFYSEKKDLFRFLTTSRLVKSFIEPRIYSKVILKSNNQVLSFAAAISGELAFCQPARHVRSLYVLCTDLTATQLLCDVPVLCPNLVHFAFDGKEAPFSSDGSQIENGSSSSEVNRKSRLTRLTVCSPSLLDITHYKDFPPIQWEYLTHLHILGPGDINDYTLYDHLLGLHLDRLVNLEHLCIQLTYPSPETELFKYTFFSEATLFYIYLKEGLIREMLERLPRIRKVIIKTNFNYPRFRLLWDDLKRMMEDVPQVSFEMKPLANQDFYESTLPCSSLSNAVWHNLLQSALDEVEQLWDREV